jgi:hypothetical protein
MAKRKATDGQLTLADTRLLDAAAEIFGESPDIRYLHTILAQCGLPYRQPDPVLRDYKRGNGRASLVLSSGHLMDPKTGEMVLQGIPYGAKPRLLMLHLCTQAKLHNSPTIEVSRSMSGLMQQLGLAVTGGKTGSIGRFKDQLNRLAATRMQLGFRDDVTGLGSTINVPSAISRYDVWFPKEPSQKILWPSTVTLSTEFFASLVDHALPLDSRAIKGLQQSAMALDLYFWLAHRLHRIPNKEPVSISWMALRSQFGPDYLEMRKFRQDFKTALSKVETVYKAAKIEMSHTGTLTLRQSPPPVPKLTLPGK